VSAVDCPTALWESPSYSKRNSPIFQSAEERTLLPDSTELFNTVDVPLLLIGDPAYLLKRWLMKVFPNVAGLNERQKKFNYRLSRARFRQPETTSSILQQSRFELERL
jgi:hypothetical protein